MTVFVLLSGLTLNRALSLSGSLNAYLVPMGCQINTARLPGRVTGVTSLRDTSVKDMSRIGHPQQVRQRNNFEYRESNTEDFRSLPTGSF